MNYLNIYKKINNPITGKPWYSDLLQFVPRFVTGYFLAANFGASKFGLPWSPAENNLGLFEVAYWFPGDVAEFGGLFAMFPVFFAWMGAFSEAIGGITYMLGFQTRLSSFLIICTMLVAIFFQKWGGGMWGMLPAMGFLWAATYNLILGSGRFGIDFLIHKRIDSQEAE